MYAVLVKPQPQYYAGPISVSGGEAAAYTIAGGAPSFLESEPAKRMGVSQDGVHGYAGGGH